MRHENLGIDGAFKLKEAFVSIANNAEDCLLYTSPHRIVMHEVHRRVVLVGGIGVVSIVRHIVAQRDVIIRNLSLIHIYVYKRQGHGQWSVCCASRWSMTG